MNEHASYYSGPRGRNEAATHVMRGILNRRSEPGRHPLHRIGLGDDLIDVIAIDAIKQAHQPTTSNGGALLTFAHRPNFKVGRLDRDDVPE